MLTFALVFNICVMAGSVDSCEGYVVETYQTVDACQRDMLDNVQALDDRFVACGLVESRYLVDRRDGRTVKQVIADLNASFPYSGGAQ